MPFVWSALAAYDVVAGLVLLALTGVVVAAGFGKRANQLFALYLFLTALSSLFVGLRKGAIDLPTATYFAYLSVWVQIPLVIAGIAFAARFPRRERIAASAPVTIGLVILTLGFYVAYFYDHGLFVTSLQTNALAGTYQVLGGPFLNLLYSLLLASQAVIFVLLTRAYLREGSEIKREQYWWVLAGLSLFYVYNFAVGAGRLAASLPTILDVPTQALVQYLTGVAGLAVVGGFALRGMQRADRGTAIRRRHERFLIPLAFPLVMGFVDAVLIVHYRGPLERYYENSQFIWRMAVGATLTYAILKYELFDLDLRLKRALANTIAFGGAAALFGGVSLSILSVTGGSPAALVGSLIVGAGVVLAAFSLLRRAGLGFAGRIFSQVEDTPGYVIERKLAVYRAAVESLVDSDGTVRGDQAETLVSLRAELGLTEREAAILEYAVRHGSRGVASTRAAYEPGSVVLGKYRVERTLGGGSYGKTYLCRDPTIGRGVAIKHMRPSGHAEDAARVLREARTLGQLQHPNVITLYDAEQVGSDVFLVMEYADGGSLRQALGEEGPLTLARASMVLRDVLEGLKAAHALGIVHRDVKPANVLLSGSGRAKLGDFGLARGGATDAQATVGGFRSVGAVLGTPAYMAPEQARGGIADTRSDLYAAGALLYECLTGETYLDFQGKSEFEIRASILSDPPRLPLRGQPAWVNRLLQKALEKDPGQRFASAEEMLGVLQAGAGAQLRAPE